MILKEKLNILSLCEWDYAGVGYLLSQATNAHTEHTCTHIRWRDSTLKYPCELLRPSHEKLAELWKRADVVHIHDDFRHVPLGLPAKPTVITWHGSMYRRSTNKHNNQAMANNWFATVATLDLLQLGSNEWMPDIRDYDKPTDKFDDFTVCHAPTSRLVKDTSTVIKACKHAGIKLELIEGKPWGDCMAVKRRCHVLVDQFKLGYGCNAIEAWALGIPVVANSDNQNTLTLMEKLFGILPFVQCDPDFRQLSDLLVRLRDDEDFYELWSERGFTHFSKFHSPKAAAKRSAGYYNLAMELFYSRPVTKAVFPIKGKYSFAGAEGMVALRYTGGNAGTELYTGAYTGAQYKFSSLDAIKLVDTNDAQHFLSIGRRGKRSGPRKQNVEKVLFELVR